MPNYRNLLPEELAITPSFRRWVLLNDPDEHVFWEEWLFLNPDKHDLVQRAKQLLIRTNEAFDRISDEEIADEIYRLSHSLGENEGKKSTKKFGLRPFWYQIAASVLLLIAIGWGIKKQNIKSGSPAPYQEMIGQVNEPISSHFNGSQKPELVTLTDGSTVLLQPNSRISFPATFDSDKREVFLSGEAFFEVAKKPLQPFYVYAGTLATKVLGTSFKVSAFEDKNEVKVVVKTGKVSVFPITPEAISKQHADENTLDGMVLTPNQQIVFAAKDQRLTRSLIDNPKVLELPIQRQSFVFKGTPIKKVFETLEKSYGVKIIFDTELTKNCYLTASLSDEPLFEKINLICKTIGAQYQQMDASIIIESKGC